MIDLGKIGSVADILRHGAERFPERTAQLFNERVTNYAELHKRACRVANGLIKEGCKPTDRIGILSRNSDTYFEVVFGAALSRAVAMCANWRLAASELVFVLNDASVQILFVSKQFYTIAEKIKSELPKLRKIIALDGEHPEWPSYAEWAAAQSDADPHLKHEADDVAVQMYTSGTTGLPKGVELSNANYLAFFKVVNSMTWSDFGKDDRILVVMPLFHVAGLNIGILALAQGATGVILGEFDPLALVGLVGKYRITHVNVVPAVILFLLQQPEVKNADFSSLKVMMYGAAPMAQDLLRQARETFGCDFAQVYGMTETTGVGTCLMPEDHIKRPEKLKSVGRPSSGIEMKIITPEGKPAKPGEVGEVMIRGACVMKGYWNKPEATAETVVDGWLRTGDAAYMDEEGYLYIHDRVKEMIISGGENIYPAEVENAIFAHPKVADVAIIGIPDDRWGEAVKAVVVVQPGEKLTAQEVIDFARDRIAHYKCPKSVDFIDALPRNPSGKILRRELRKPYWVGRERMVS
jgi:fatty-acyl-CoA synthase